MNRIKFLILAASVCVLSSSCSQKTYKCTCTERNCAWGEIVDAKSVDDARTACNSLGGGLTTCTYDGKYGK